MKKSALNYLPLHCTACLHGVPAFWASPYKAVSGILFQPIGLRLSPSNWSHTAIDPSASLPTNWSSCILLFNFKPFKINVQIQLSPFSTTTFPCPTYPHLLPSILPPFGFVHGSFIHDPWQPFPFFPLSSPSPVPAGHGQFVLYFHVSGCILLACLFCWLGSTYRWDHMVFVFLDLESIMLSEVIQAVKDYLFLTLKM